MTDQAWFYILAFVWAVDTSLVGVMLWWGRKSFTPPQYGRFCALFTVCAQRMYVNIMVAPRDNITFEWKISGTTLLAGITVLIVMMWSFSYNAKRGGPEGIRRRIIENGKDADKP